MFWFDRLELGRRFRQDNFMEQHILDYLNTISCQHYEILITENSDQSFSYICKNCNADSDRPTIPKDPNYWSNKIEAFREQDKILGKIEALNESNS